MVLLSWCKYTLACSNSSKSRTPAPSPITNPSRFCLKREPYFKIIITINYRRNENDTIALTEMSKTNLKIKISPTVQKFWIQIYSWILYSTHCQISHFQIGFPLMKIQHLVLMIQNYHLLILKLTKDNVAFSAFTYYH